MQHLHDNDIRKLPSERKKGLIGTLIVHSVLLLVMFLVVFKIPPPPDFEEGILVNFGTGETGFGLIEPAPLYAASASESFSVPVPVSTPPRSATAPRANTTEEQLLTQETEDAPEVRRVDPNAERIRREQAAEAERIRRETLEAERIRREEAERIAAEQRAQAEAQRLVSDAFAASRNAGTSPLGSPQGVVGGRNIGSTSTSEGINGGPSNQGVPTGSTDSRVRGDGGTGTGSGGTGAGSGGNRVSYELGGRRSQSLPLPRYDSQVEGRVVVEIRVNSEGRVTQATPGQRGSTTLNETLLSAAREAAMQTRFEPSNVSTQVGTITYNFVLR